jgi:hypothetical protein
MNRFRTTLPALVLACLGPTAAGQQPATLPAQPAYPAISLGRPTPLGSEPARGPLGSFVPLRSSPPRSRSVVRACSWVLQDESKGLFPPTIALPPVIDKVGDEAQLEQPAQALQPIPAKDKAKIIEVEPPGGLPILPDLPMVTEPRILDRMPLVPQPLLLYEEPPIVFEGDEPTFSFPGQGSRMPRWYGGAEWLYWWTPGFHLPPLVTTGPATAPFDNRGALGVPGTQVIFGDSNTPTQPRSGGRFTLGHAIGCDGLGIDGTFFFLGSTNTTFLADSSQFPFLARPFFNVNTGLQDREVVTNPQVLASDPVRASGNIQVQTSSQLLGAELNLRKLLWCCDDCRITGLVGFRYLNLSESLGITESSLLQNRVLAGNIVLNPGDQITVFDGFQTRNNFYGGQFGLQAQKQFGRWSLDGFGKIAFGTTVQTVNVNGSQAIIPLHGAEQDFVGGLYAAGSNIGSQTQRRFAVVPEIGIKIGYNITENIRLFVGYDFLCWSSVVRPGDQIDPNLNVNFVPNSGGGPVSNQVRPLVPFRTTNYWAQGVTAGVEIRY